jgi:hypothetical protein
MNTNETKWPDRGIVKVQEAVEEWEQKHPDSRAMRITWGFHNKEEEEEARSRPEDRKPRARLEFCDHYYEINLAKSGDPNYPDRCLISTDFLEWPGFHLIDLPDLPLGDPKKMYNVLDSCEGGVKLQLVPDLSGDSGPAIVIVGLATQIPIEALSARTLSDALQELYISTNCVLKWLLKNQGDDHWFRDAG